VVGVLLGPCQNSATPTIADANKTKPIMINGALLFIYILVFNTDFFTKTII
jgi:hypothetical protein